MGDLKRQIRRVVKRELKKLMDATRDVARDIFNDVLVRCTHCGEFSEPEHVTIEWCRVCAFYAARCEFCGGERAARRGIAMHLAFYVSRRGRRRDDGAHVRRLKQEGYL